MDKTSPLLLEIPEQICSERLDIRVVRPGDGEPLCAAALDSLEQLKPWFPWAEKVPTIIDTEARCRECYSKFVSRTDINLALWLKGTRTCVGRSGLHKIDWDIPKFEIGYWARSCHAGKGYITEAVSAITAFAFDVLAARRVEIRMDDRNERSWRVAQRCGFDLEGILRNSSRRVAGQLRDTRVYAKVRPDDAATCGPQGADSQAP